MNWQKHRNLHPLKTVLTLPTELQNTVSLSSNNARSTPCTEAYNSANETKKQ
eukprot:c55385_g1_i1 orf=113-268(+)